MFFTGALLIYSGFNNTTPIAVVRSFLSGNRQSTDDGIVDYDPRNDPFFYGVSSGNPGFYR